MRIDNLHDIGIILGKNKIWFHVDACHGSQLTFFRTHRHKIQGIIDARLALTKEFQNKFQEHKDVILLNETDINSCMFIFMLRFLHQGKPISTDNIQKLNECNLFIKTNILDSGKALVHGFNIKRCSHQLLPDGEMIYVLRTINRNPLTTAGHLKDILDMVVKLGNEFQSKSGS